MSTQVKGITEIRDRLIAEQTLKELGISFQEVSQETLTWGSGYDKVTLDLSTGEVGYDSDRSYAINELKQTYSKNFIMAEIVKKGHRIDAVNKVGADIEITASY